MTDEPESPAAPALDIEATVARTAEKNVSLTIDGATFVFTPFDATRLAGMIEAAAGRPFYAPTHLRKSVL